MATVISGDSLAKHNVEKYNFKVIALGSPNESVDKSRETQQSSSIAQESPKAQKSDIDSSAMSTNSKDSLIESLMQKTDEMSSNFIKLQMKLEAKEEEYQQSLKEAQESSFSQGMEAGVAKAVEDGTLSVGKSLEQFAHSVSKLDVSANEFKSALEGIKKELMYAAIDISEEVIKVELSHHSSEVAKLLADELIAELQSASKITLKVNPKDHGSLSEHLGKLEHIDIISDSAISEGGVIVVSDAGNIDAQIQKRFQRVKKAVLNE